MRTMSALGRAATFAALVSGCSAAQVTQPTPVGPDTYKVSARYRGGPATARDAAISAANQHCAQLSKQLRVLSSSANTVWTKTHRSQRKRECRRRDFPLHCGSRPLDDARLPERPGRAAPGRGRNRAELRANASAQFDAFRIENAV